MDVRAATALSYPTVRAFAAAKPALPPGVVAILMCEAEAHAARSARHLAELGASAVIAVGAAPAVGEPGVPVIGIAERPELRTERAILNALWPALVGRWVVWLWNGEFLFFPFCETRTLSDLTNFLGDERRTSLYAYALDLYGHDMPAPAEAPEHAALQFDRIGYHAFPKEGQQLRLFGGLGWRFEELCPPELQQIGRTVLLRVAPGTALDRERLFGQTVYDSVSCPWHHNPTGAVMSLRRSRRILAHPGFAEVADRLIWEGSTRFAWQSRQLLELGMIEPGQWF